MLLTFVYFGSSVAAAYFVAIVVWPLLKFGGWLNFAGTLLAIIGIAVCPAIVPAENVIARAFACLVCIDPWFRVIDYARQVRAGSVNPITLRAYCWFLVPFPFLLAVFDARERTRRPVRRASIELLRMLVGAAIAAVALMLCFRCQHVPLLRESFLLDHLTKLLLFVVGAEAASQVQVAVERLLGFDAPPIIHRAYRARTPAEFWFRYNQRVRQWLFANVFVPCGGRRSPTKGVFCVFLVSAVFHEFFFALATSRADGYQFAFFMMQAPAVMLSTRLERLARRCGRGRFVAHAVTWLWFAATSMLFFHGMDRVFPFLYASEPWLP